MRGCQILKMNCCDGMFSTLAACEPDGHGAPGARIWERSAGRIVHAIIEVVRIEPERASLGRPAQRRHQRILADEAEAVEPEAGVDEPLVGRAILVRNRCPIEVRDRAAIRSVETVLRDHVRAGAAGRRLTGDRA